MLMATAPCWVSQDEAQHARRQGQIEAFDEALERYADENYGPPWDASLLDVAFERLGKNAPRELATQMAHASAGLARYQTTEAAYTQLGRIFAGFVNDLVTELCEKEMRRETAS